ncbi:MAG: hypothetical protein PHP75_00820 [Methylacidiphilaceae bacterium]|nr:hypothetical protein [Candidatus Methylacidiphilaceae bacterium]
MKGKQVIETKLNEQLRNFFANRLAEKATPEYFEGMLGQVHRRLRQELVGRPRWWDRFAELFTLSLPELRPLFVRYALPLVLFGAVGGFVLQHGRLAPLASKGTLLSAAGSPSLMAGPSWTRDLGSSQDLLIDKRDAGAPALIRPTIVWGAGGEVAAEAKDRGDGGRSFASLLPVRYEASVDF